MSVRVSDDLTPEEHEELSKAWLDVVKGLEVYERITGADLIDITNDEIWENVEFQKFEEGN